MKINLDYKQPESSDEKQLSNQALTWDYINYAVRKKYPELAFGPMMQTFASIQRKFDDALAQNADEIDFSDDEIGFMRHCVEDCAFPVWLSKFIVIFKNELFNNAYDPKAA
jgi:hypothetical protein